MIEKNTAKYKEIKADDGMVLYKGGDFFSSACFPLDKEIDKTLYLELTEEEALEMQELYLKEIAEFEAIAKAEEEKTEEEENGGIEEWEE